MLFSTVVEALWRRRRESMRTVLELSSPLTDQAVSAWLKAASARPFCAVVPETLLPEISVSLFGTPLTTEFTAEVLTAKFGEMWVGLTVTKGIALTA